MLVRLAVVGVALVSSAWFVVSARQARDATAASAIIFGSKVSAAQARRATDLLNGASFLNPDREVPVLQGSLAADEGDNVRARRILLRVIREEPDDLQAWLAFARASSDSPVAFIAAQIGIRRLVANVQAPR